MTASWARRRGRHPGRRAKLCANGAGDPSRLRQAIWTYNHSWDYVDKVMAHAARYASFVLSGSADPALIQAVLDNAEIDIYAAGRDDIAAGRIDNRILTILQQAAPSWRTGV